MKYNKLALLFIPLLLSSCSPQSNLVKIFISSFKDVDINALKAEFKSDKFSIEAKIPIQYCPYVCILV